MLVEEHDDNRNKETIEAFGKALEYAIAETVSNISKPTLEFDGDSNRTNIFSNFENELANKAEGG